MALAGCHAQLAALPQDQQRSVKPRVISAIYLECQIVEGDMRRKSILLFAFPALILLILAGERMAAFLLGAFPASPTMWRIWLELRPLSTMFWQQIDL